MRGMMKGFFKPKNPQKYKGDPTNIVYRSSWEFKLMKRLDHEPSVLRWSSENVIIPYRSPLDDKFHRYFVDFWVEVLNGQGQKAQMLIEIKPSTQVRPPITREKSQQTKSYMREVYTYAVNEAKWSTAREYCKKRGWKFKIMTEKELGLTK